MLLMRRKSAILYGCHYAVHLNSLGHCKMCAQGKISAAVEHESTTLRISYPGAIILPEVEQVPVVYRLVINSICPPPPPHCIE